MSELPKGPWLKLGIDFCGPLPTGEYLYPCSTELLGSSFTRRKQGLLILVTHGRLSCYSLMNHICICQPLGQCLTCRA